MSQADELDDLLIECYYDPGLFHEGVLNRPPLHAKQEAIARSVVENRVTVVPAAHAVGKSWYAATAVLQWLYTRDNAKVITTSASNNQLTSVLWGAIKGAHARAAFKLGGTISEGTGIPQRVQLGPEHYAIGFSAKKPESFSGFHGDDILVVTDESSGIDQPIWDAIESLGYTSLLALGNPIRSKGHFRTLWDLSQSGAEDYAGFHLTAFDSPHADLTDKEIKQRGLAKGLCSRTWIESARRVYGEGSVYWKTRVLAEFPDEDYDQLIPTSWVDRCVSAKRPSGLAGGPRRMAIDLAKGTGRDRTVILVGDDMGDLYRYINNRTDVMGAAQLAKQLSVEWGIPHNCITYDVGGWAGSDMTRYLEALDITDAIPYQGGKTGAIRFKNRRARSAWKLRQRLDPDRPCLLPQTGPDPNARGWSIADRGRIPAPLRSVTQPPYYIIQDAHWDDEREELINLRYSHAEAKIALEKKELCQERLGRSPDIADTRIMLASLWED